MILDQSQSDYKIQDKSDTKLNTGLHSVGGEWKGNAQRFNSTWYQFFQKMFNI